MATPITAPTAAQLLELRAVAPDKTVHDDILKVALQRYPLLDEQGQLAYTLIPGAGTPAYEGNAYWLPTYDVHAAAADLWEGYASGLTGNYDFATDGQSFNRSQVYAQAMKQVRYHRSRRVPKSMRGISWPKELTSVSWIGNLPEPRD